MIRKRNPLDETMTFGIGVPIDIFGIDPPSAPQNRVLPSQFSLMIQPMKCAFIKNTFPNQPQDMQKTADTF